MKTLNKFIINPEKLLKQGELLNLKGGQEWHCTVQCDGGYEDTFDFSTVGNVSKVEAEFQCTEFYYSGGAFPPATCDCFCN